MNKQIKLDVISDLLLHQLKILEGHKEMKLRLKKKINDNERNFVNENQK